MKWIKEKWEIVVAIIVGVVVSLLTAFSMMVNSQKQKEILKNANESHEKETKVNLEAKKDLVEGIEKIDDKKDDEIKHVVEKFDKDLEAAKKSTSDTADTAKKDGTLAKKLADAIGADFVENND